MAIYNSDKVIYSGGIGGVVPVTPSIAHNSLFTGKSCLFWGRLGASLYTWPEKIIRGIIYVGLNTLSRSITIKI